MEGKFRFKESELVADISEKLRDSFGNELSHEQSREYAQKALEQIRVQGNQAIYQMFLSQGIIISSELYRQSNEHMEKMDEGMKFQSTHS